jgi:hypothetical protein
MKTTGATKITSNHDIVSEERKKFSIAWS